MLMVSEPGYITFNYVWYDVWAIEFFFTQAIPSDIGPCQQAPGIYIMNKEYRVDVPIRFSEKDITLLPFICFFKTLAVSRIVQEHDLNSERTCYLTGLCLEM